MNSLAKPRISVAASEDSKASTSRSSQNGAKLTLQTLTNRPTGIFIPGRPDEKGVLKPNSEPRDTAGSSKASTSPKKEAGGTVESVLRWVSLGRTFTITKHNMASLAPKTFVNDNVVHFGMRYLLTAPRPLRDKASPRRARWDQIRVMDSLWFTKIQTAWEATPRDDTWFSKKKSRPNLIMDSRWFTKIQTAWEASPRDEPGSRQNSRRTSTSLSDRT
ncbi:hypothetical protein CF319_g7479 [Tilletia indica]|nr:hypothetical protein CF319_g7479 [Tilletia indica]